MSQRVQCYVTSPTGRLRIWCGVFLLGLPFVFVLAWTFNGSESKWHITGAARLLTIALVLMVLVASIAVGIYYTLFQTTVTIDSAVGNVICAMRICGAAVHRRIWRLSEFKRIELRHRPYGDGPSDTFQTDVGIRHSSGFVVWLRAFWSLSAGPSAEAAAFAGELENSLGLPCETLKT
jgi:hypothetical protein